jgi:hypothetical protein
MDSFGDWYRRSRDIHAIELPGVNTVVNAAHNVPLDMFAFGGWPLLLTYVSIMGLTGVSTVKLIIRSKTYDPILAVLVTAWAGYQVQSIISINQIGLAVWGWVLTGALIAYESTQRKGNQVEISKAKTPLRKTKQQSEFFSNPLIAGLGAVVGLILACPPISADMAWVKATRSGNFTEVQKALEPSYLHPRSSERLVNAISIMESSKLYDQAREYALIATAYNPDSFDSWSALYSVQNSTAEEKALALENMKRLDPRNPDVTAR